MFNTFTWLYLIAVYITILTVAGIVWLVRRTMEYSISQKQLDMIVNNKVKRLEEKHKKPLSQITVGEWRAGADDDPE